MRKRFKPEINQRGHEISAAYFGKKLKRKGNAMEKEFDFEEGTAPVGKMSLAEAREYFNNRRKK